MSRPLLSVLMPLREAEPTLPEAVESVLAQREVDLELLAVDDGSRDGGPRWLRARARGEPRLRVLQSAGRGIAAALRTGLGAARGRFVARMDADDVSLPGRFAASLERFEREPALDLVAVQVAPWPPPAAGLGLYRYVSWQNGLLEPADHLRERFVEAPVCHPAVVFRADTVRRLGGYRAGPFPEDYELWLRMLGAGCRFAKVPRVLLRWRHGPRRATFTDPRCAPERLLQLKARYLAAWLGGRRWVLWGAGRTGKRLGRAMAALGRGPARVVDVAAGGRRRLLGRLAVEPPGTLEPRRECVVVAVGLPSARPLIRATLASLGFREPEDALFAA